MFEKQPFLCQGSGAASARVSLAGASRRRNDAKVFAFASDCPARLGSSLVIDHEGNPRAGTIYD